MTEVPNSKALHDLVNTMHDSKVNKNYVQHYRETIKQLKEHLRKYPQADPAQHRKSINEAIVAKRKEKEAVQKDHKKFENTVTQFANQMLNSIHTQRDSGEPPLKRQRTSNGGGVGHLKSALKKQKRRK